MRNLFPSSISARSISPTSQPLASVGRQKKIPMKKVSQPEDAKHGEDGSTKGGRLIEFVVPDSSSGTSTRQRTAGP